MTGLVGWWPLHENSGTKAYDLSGNENHGSLNGGITQGVAGKGGLTSYSFDGSDDYTSLPSYPTFSSATISAWVYETGSGGSPLGILSNNYLAFRTSSGGELLFQMNSNINISKTVSSNNWYHLVGTWDGNTQEFYVDGVLVGSNSVSSMQNKSEGDSIGRRSNVSGYKDFFGGNICDVRVYDRALSPEEIQELYEMGNGDYARTLNDQNSSSAVSRWAFDGDATDSWSGNDGSVNGATYVSDGGMRNGAYSFDGDDDYITADSVSEQISGSSFTISSWINTSSSTSIDVIQAFNTSTGGNNMALQLDNGQLTFYDGNSHSGKSVNKGEWIFVALTIDAGSDKFATYINGITDLKGDTTSTVNSDDQYSIGQEWDSSNPSNFFDGLIDDVRIYDKALSPSEVFELYRWGTRGRDLRKQLVNQR